jgi:hypothetical protein
MSWASITWIFMHSFAYKIDNTYYKNNKSVPCNVISYICTNLPCPMCKSHAILYLKNNNIKLCNTKKEFINYICNFHNSVNVRLGKKTFTKEECNELYSRCNFERICPIFFAEFQKPYYFGRTMTSWRRRNVSEKVKKYLYYNWQYFN